MNRFGYAYQNSLRYNDVLGFLIICNTRDTNVEINESDEATTKILSKSNYYYLMPVISWGINPDHKPPSSRRVRLPIWSIGYELWRQTVTTSLVEEFKVIKRILHQFTVCTKYELDKCGNKKEVGKYFFKSSKDLGEFKRKVSSKKEIDRDDELIHRW